MNRVEIVVDGVVVIYDDITSEVKRQAEILAELEALYGSFEEKDWPGMVRHELRLLDLWNEFQKLGYIISQYQTGQERRENIVGIWRDLQSELRAIERRGSNS